MDSVGFVIRLIVDALSVVSSGGCIVLQLMGLSHNQSIKQ
jgi:hypothetical protein